MQELVFDAKRTRKLPAIALGNRFSVEVEKQKKSAPSNVYSSACRLVQQVIRTLSDYHEILVSINHSCPYALCVFLPAGIKRRSGIVSRELNF